jgi:dienelactone hydrolase
MAILDYLSIDDTLPEIGQRRQLPPDMVKGFTSNVSSILARSNAPAQKQRFPVVIYAPSLSASAAENADLCELLASQGYVVFASPSHGRATRLMTDDVEGVRAQARDISFLIDYAQTQPNTNMGAVAAIGYSWGGLSNIYAASQDRRIKALVSLDGSIRYYVSVAWDSGIHPEQMTQPLLIFTQGYIPLESDLVNALINKGRPSLLSSWSHADVYKIEMAAMDHGAFASMNLRNEGIWNEQQGPVEPGYDRSDVVASYEALSRYTLAFLNSTLKHDAQAAAFLKQTPNANGVPKHLMNVNFSPAVGLAPTLEAFQAELEKRGFSHALDIFAEARRADPAFKVDEKALIAWGRGDLLDQGKIAEATEVFRLAVSMYPASSNAYANLAEAEYRAGNKGMAVENFKKALELDPENYFAMDRLKELQ